MAADPLESYKAKRDFTKTREPEGTPGTGSGNLFVVHKHAARRLHFDLRLELDGVLKSWAVTKGPSLDPADKRLAVRTEDHPLAYGTFEGCIPEGEYGGGTVMLWDYGTWEPVATEQTDLDAGKLHFLLHGERMSGEWLLVRMRGKKTAKRENWLLRKIEDDAAGGADELTARALTSVKTGRSMREIAVNGQARAAGSRVVRKPAKKPSRKQAQAGKLPRFRQPQLATLADSVPAGNHWLHEIKYDGYRCLVSVAGARARLFTRSGKDWSSKFPEIVSAAAALNVSSALLDGEIVKADEQGNPDFSALQRALKTGTGGFNLFAFDLLELNGADLTNLTTVERKERLAALLAGHGEVIRFGDHVIGAGEKLLRAMCEAGHEGIISKRVDTPYRHRRSRDWRKIKCTRREEFVIIGWRTSRAVGRPFASILLAQHEHGELVYKGRAGTGFSAELMDELANRFARIARKTPPALVPKEDARDAHWITPRLVAEIAFTEFTADGRVRHASFVGLRDDKDATEVAPERSITSHATIRDVPEIAISNRDRVVFPDAQATKGDVADYYARVAPLMLPWLAHRPLSIVRCPRGRANKCFFQKHHPGSFGEHVHAVPIAEKEGGVEDYLYVADRSGLLECVQMGTIEFHGWGASIDPLEQPDRMVFDLDPGEGVSFNDVKRAADRIRRQLAEINLLSFALLSGGKGIHVVVPLTAAASWPVVKDFARRFSRALAQMAPDRFTATSSKAQRTGRIFIDWLRNQRGATSVLPYSVRARPGAPVAAPVAWNEFAACESAARFSIADADALIKRANSPNLRRWGTAHQSLPDV